MECGNKDIRGGGKVESMDGHHAGDQLFGNKMFIWCLITQTIFENEEGRHESCLGRRMSTYLTDVEQQEEEHATRLVVVWGRVSTRPCTEGRRGRLDYIWRRRSDASQIYGFPAGEGPVGTHERVRKGRQVCCRLSSARQSTKEGTTKTQHPNSKSSK